MSATSSGDAPTRFGPPTVAYVFRPKGPSGRASALRSWKIKGNTGKRVMDMGTEVTMRRRDVGGMAVIAHVEVQVGRAHLVEGVDDQGIRE